MTGDTKPAMLIVDDERVVAWDEREMVKGFGLRVLGVAASAEQALESAERR